MVQIRTSLISLLYTKALRMSTAAKQDTSVGEIVSTAAGFSADIVI